MATGPAATAIASARWVVTVPIAKAAIPPTGPVRAFGWASVATEPDGTTPIVDHQEDVIPSDELELAAYDFTSAAGEFNAHHAGPSIGRVIESVVLTKEKRESMGLPEGAVAWWVGVEITDPGATARARAGEFSEFSIEGRADRELLVGSA